ncbi:MAG: hypothetical protein GW878_03790, partial [Acidobacteria bacterium]|nr:hypothetical protein [Acidobacteriota bacterium]
IGRPAIRSLPAVGLIARVWARFEGWWDRWVLTLSLFDQLDLLRVATDVLRRFGVPAAGVAGLAALLALLAGTRRRRETGGAAAVPAGGGRLGRAVSRVTDAARRAGMIGSAELTPRALAAAVDRAGVADEVEWLVVAHEQARY